MTERIRLTLNHAEIVGQLLSNGQRVAAAQHAEQATEHADERIRDLVRVLSNELRTLGDRHAKKGRPRANSNVRGEFNRVFALRDYRAAIYARQLHDRDELNADELSNFAWFAGLSVARTARAPNMVRTADEIRRHNAEFFALDMQGARDELLPHANTLLKRLKLEPTRITRRGFRVATLHKVAVYWKISKDVLKRQLAQ